MIRLLLIIIFILFFLWLALNLFSSSDDNFINVLIEIIRFKYNMNSNTLSIE